MFSVTQKAILTKYFSDLRYSIIKIIEGIEDDNADFYEEYYNNRRFEMKKWERLGGGGGEIGLLKGGVFEKMGVNFSEVFGEFENKELAKSLPGYGVGNEFWASGVSLVSHPRNPHIPPIHMNLRGICTSGAAWFGGALDLNPIFFDQGERDFFHNELKKICDKHGVHFYEKFSKECDEYFFIKHRNESRGIGGIFFDYLLIEDNFEKTFAFISDIGDSFGEIYRAIVDNKVKKIWSDEERNFQLLKRGKYVEFNLIYDRGIKFGLGTGGNSDAMMMSLPPLVKWD